MSIFQKIILIFTIVGGLNWGLIGFFDFNLVEYITFGNTMIEQLIYAVVGICALINIYLLFVRCDKDAI